MTDSSGPRFPLPDGFLMGASTSAHQVEGNNVSSDLWALENQPGSGIPERSGDAVDSFHRWPEDMDLLRDLGFNAYRFSIEWARIEPEQGHVSRAAVAHYRSMVRGAVERGLTPVVTLHHFTSPRWFSARGGWLAEDAAELFAAYTRTAVEVLGDDVRYVVTINEPNMLALVHAVRRRAAEQLRPVPAEEAEPSPAGVGETSAATADGKPSTAEDGHTGGVAFDPSGVEPDPDVTAALIAAHRAAYRVLKEADPRYQVGWTVANQVYQAEPGAEEVAAAYARPREDVFLEAARDDDWVGVQAYTRHRIGPHGPLPVPEGAETTLTGWEFHPEALGEAVRHTRLVVGADVPVIVTENGIATPDDERRVAYTERALASLVSEMRAGADVRGYLHWSALDNYEWGSYRPTFGLVAVDPVTFARTPKPSARWLGSLARDRNLPCGADRPRHAPVAAR
ncbi:family 1 glycosylhydrolase [Streptomyces sp. b94]|uniref:glycoside hydrolase family 1 protein n=1 Tax=Streptomyces sp. b94 TaxID=1827634 RepID=UPI001B378556|nr:family 1 glycosylhydrolase [Streptomyces sp. b94]MBQ1095411.1 family 1 glycosylhydrolase [Streptomyces sp. b94]